MHWYLYGNLFQDFMSSSSDYLDKKNFTGPQEQLRNVLMLSAKLTSLLLNYVNIPISYVKYYQNTIKI